MLAALEYMHGHHVVHRDIKCENVLLAHAGVPIEQNLFKLCDLGFAARDRGLGLSDRLGSPDTVAPEVVRGSTYGTPVDIWSTGVLVYMMLAATPPFSGSTDSEVLKKVLTGTYNLGSAIWERVYRLPKRMIARLITVDASLRPTATLALRDEWLTGVSTASAP